MQVCFLLVKEIDLMEGYRWIESSDYFEVNYRKWVCVEVSLDNSVSSPCLLTYGSNSCTPAYGSK